MMGKLQIEIMGQISNTNLRFTKEEGRVEIFMIYIIMMEEIFEIGIDQIAEIGEFNLVDKVELGQGMSRIIAEEILGVM